MCLLSSSISPKEEPKNVLILLKTSDSISSEKQ
jgi:hypothetical protein